MTSRAQPQREKSKYRSDSQVLRAPPSRINLKPALIDLDLTQLPLAGLCDGTAGLGAPRSNSRGRRRRWAGKIQGGIWSGKSSSGLTCCSSKRGPCQVQNCKPQVLCSHLKKGGSGDASEAVLVHSCSICFSLGGKDTGVQNSQSQGLKTGLG